MTTLCKPRQLNTTTIFQLVEQFRKVTIWQGELLQCPWRLLGIPESPKKQIQLQVTKELTEVTEANLKACSGRWYSFKRLPPSWVIVSCLVSPDLLPHFVASLAWLCTSAICDVAFFPFPHLKDVCINWNLGFPCFFKNLYLRPLAPAVAGVFSTIGGVYICVTNNLPSFDVLSFPCRTIYLFLIAWMIVLLWYWRRYFLAPAGRFETSSQSAILYLLDLFV